MLSFREFPTPEAQFPRRPPLGLSVNKARSRSPYHTSPTPLHGSPHTIAADTTRMTTTNKSIPTKMSPICISLILLAPPHSLASHP